MFNSSSITQQLPISIETRLFKVSSREKVFNKSVFIHQETLNKSGYNYKLKFHKTSNDNTQHGQQVKEISSGLIHPFSKSVVTKTENISENNWQTFPTTSQATQAS